ncbi:hypothetical protein FH972_001483 [Carpinus fangiana]|uniref:Uncharacterized protein n=1 Tax=Carpinus fangiana TaxID=176857 RepID=A0A5N6QBU6_9ROSI|nr:hypothetical protein FH972_001483 [Carpinus fangiana]
MASHNLLLLSLSLSPFPSLSLSHFPRVSNFYKNLAFELIIGLWKSSHKPFRQKIQWQEYGRTGTQARETQAPARSTPPELSWWLLLLLVRWNSFFFFFFALLSKKVLRWVGGPMKEQEEQLGLEEIRNKQRP